MADDGSTNGTTDEHASETTHEPRRRQLHAVPAYRPSTDGVMRLANLGPYETELGGHIPNVTLAYRTWGTLNAREAFLAEYPALTETVLATYERARAWIQENPEETARAITPGGWFRTGDIGGRDQDGRGGGSDRGEGLGGDLRLGRTPPLDHRRPAPPGA